MSEVIHHQYVEEAVLIRSVEEELLRLYRQGLVNGTVHTCTGQEFSALAFCKQLKDGDFVYSNHRCHGHYIAFTGDVKGLTLELTGRSGGTCGGIGGSQHLFHNKRRFFSNGIQGGITGVSAGIALSYKLKKTTGIGVVFIGDGTLGQGLVYETLNIISKWEIPLLIVLENNHYAQSTAQEITLAGKIAARPAAFGIATFESSIYETDKLFEDAAQSISYVRSERKPAFHIVETYRLSAHSTGDDLRDPKEIRRHSECDPLNIIKQADPALYKQIELRVDAKIAEALSEVKTGEHQPPQNYYGDVQAVRSEPLKWTVVSPDVSRQRVINKVNAALMSLMDKYEDVILIGEDIHSPYGGAFKATKDLSLKYPGRVLTTAISEAAITAVANGLAMGGFRPFVEIMFGDFITLAFDQIVNHASKFYHMYNKQISCPVVIRTPMGGTKGFGPTHSQSLEKFLIGIDNVKVIALNRLTDIVHIYDTIYKQERHPVIVIENKVDYARVFGQVAEEIFNNYTLESLNTGYPVVRFSPKDTKADVTIITYGGTVNAVLSAANSLFFEKDILSEIIVLTQIHPIEYKHLSVAIGTDYIFTAEECSASGGIGSEIISILCENGHASKRLCRVSSMPVPIPAAGELERVVLINATLIVNTVWRVYSGN
ncbi:MAG: thiamine pyrophosphate-dependent enzyme [Nitrospirae bacterium YQR-1]